MAHLVGSTATDLHSDCKLGGQQIRTCIVNKLDELEVTKTELEVTKREWKETHEKLTETHSQLEDQRNTTAQLEQDKRELEQNVELFEIESVHRKTGLQRQSSLKEGAFKVRESEKVAERMQEELQTSLFKFLRQTEGVPPSPPGPEPEPDEHAEPEPGAASRWTGPSASLQDETAAQKSAAAEVARQQELVVPPFTEPASEPELEPEVKLAPLPVAEVDMFSIE